VNTEEQHTLSQAQICISTIVPCFRNSFLIFIYHFIIAFPIKMQFWGTVSNHFETKHDKTMSMRELIPPSRTPKLHLGSVTHCLP
jgi:hypothetical protein